MSILHELDKCLNSDIPAYMEFLYRYNPKKAQVFAFYEGDEDAAFYRQFIRKHLSTAIEIEEIVVGCKNTVVKLQKNFDWQRYKKHQIVFFVDRDLSYWLRGNNSYDENIFVTDGYSFENYLVNKDIFAVWLKRFMGFARATNQEIATMKKEFQDVISCFHRMMMPIMAKAVVAKCKNSAIHLDEYKPINDIHLTINAGHIHISINSNIAVDEKWGLTSDNESEIRVQQKAFLDDLENYWVRGKWDLLFMALIGDFMRQNASVFAPSLQKEKLNCTCSVPATQCATALAPYWETEPPRRLEMFLNRTIAYYCKNVA